MKKRAIATTAIVALLVLGAVSATFAYSMALSANSSGNSSTTATGEHEHENDDDNDQGQKLNLTVGETLTFSNLKAIGSLSLTCRAATTRTTTTRPRGYIQGTPQAPSPSR